MGERSGDLAHRAGGSAALLSTERSPGVGRPDVLGGAVECLFRTGDVASAQTDESQFDEGPAKLATHPRTKLFARPECLWFGSFARAAQP